MLADESLNSDGVDVAKDEHVKDINVKKKKLIKKGCWMKKMGCNPAPLHFLYP